MLLRISVLSSVMHENGDAVTDSELIASINRSECEGRCADYLDADLADLGITGGSVRLVFDEASNSFRVVSEFQVPAVTFVAP